MEVKIRLQERLRQLRETIWANPVVKLCVKSLGAMAVSVLLAGASAAESCLPLSVAFAAALGLSLPAFAAYAGGCIGYIVFWGMSGAMEPMAAGLLVVASSCVFDDVLLKHHRWFGPLCAALFTGLVGFLFLVDSEFAASAVWRWALRIAVAGAAAGSFRRALDGKPADRLVLLACLAMGLCALRPWGDLPVGAVAAAALSAAAMPTPLALPAAAFCGLAMELSWQPGSATAVLMAATLLCRSQQGKVLRLALWCLSVLTGVLITGAEPILLLALVLGGLCSPLIPGSRLLGSVKPALQQTSPRLENLSQLLEQLSRCLAMPQRRGPEPETAAVFDRASERVCRLCPQWDQCWETEAAATLEALQQASGPMLLRGQTRRSDFPASFSGKCRRMDALMAAMDRELEDLRCRRQCRSRLRESRMVLSMQYGALSKVLMDSGVPRETCRFRPQLGFRGQGRRDTALSGDKGASFRLGRWYYVLLCDGMGSGPAAAGEAAAAVAVLERLLKAGMSPTEALQILNGVYLLRDDGGFATVDLVQADLVTGKALLYKWGGAPSYLKRRGSVEPVGTLTPPPGISSCDAPPPGIDLSLSRGEILVLVSDGISGPGVEQCIRSHDGRSAKDLAAAVVAAAETDDDDRTAAVLFLQPL